MEMGQILVFSADLRHHHYKLQHCRTSVRVCDVVFDCAGNAVVPVANCNEERSYSHPKVNMKFSEFVTHMTEQDTSSSEKEKTVLYLKDWHCQRHVSLL